MIANNAFISLNQIINSWLIKKRKTVHSKWIALPLAQEAVQELALTSLPLVRHTLITRQEGQSWFALPNGLTAVVSVGVRRGDSYREITQSTRLLPFGRYDVGSDFTGTGWGKGFEQQGSQTTWNGSDNVPVSTSGFSDTDFNSVDFDTSSETAISSNDNSPYGYGDNRPDHYAVDLANGQIMVGGNFPSDEIYLVWVGIGTVDTMTHIPLIAQAAIEAYIDWKYIQNKRDGIREGGAYRQLFIKQHKILRARVNPITPKDIMQLRNAMWMTPQVQALNTLSATNPDAIPNVLNIANYYFAVQSTQLIPSDATIAATYATQLAVSGGITVTFPDAMGYSVLLYPTTQTDPTQFFIDAFSNGPLGSGLFSSPVTHGNFKVITSNYITQISSQVTFS